MSREIRFRAWDNKNKKWLGDFCFEQGRYHTMQYTDLKDKNGKEIYEGDIFFEDSGNEYVKVVFNRARFEVVYSGERVWGSLIDFLMERDFEVIGNIYENPELLNES